MRAVAALANQVSIPSQNINVEPMSPSVTVSPDTVYSPKRPLHPSEPLKLPSASKISQDSPVTLAVPQVPATFEVSPEAQPTSVRAEAVMAAAVRSDLSVRFMTTDYPFAGEQQVLYYRQRAPQP